MKDDENTLLLAKFAEPDKTLRDLAERIGMNLKRANYIAEKWQKKRWAECGVSNLTAWLTDEGKRVAAEMHSNQREER